MDKKSFTQKQKVALALIKSHKADGILLISPINRFWFTGFETEFGLCLVTKGCSNLFVDNRDYEHCKKTTSEIIVRLYNGLASVSDLIKKLKMKKIIVEKEYLTLLQLETIVKPLRIKKVLPINLGTLRSVKTDEEIVLMKKSAVIAYSALDAAKSWIKPGVTELQTKTFISKKMLDLGATKNSFDLIVAFGENSSIPHHQPTSRKLKSSEFIKIDIGCVYKGYCSDITRTFWIGKPTNKMLDMYKTVLTANKLGIQSAKSGITGAALDNVCREYIDSTPYKGYFTHGTGHGVGLAIHESPYVNSAYDLPLQFNSVVTIEPGIYIPGFGGVRIEDSIVIKNSKPVVLTKSCKK